MRHTNRQSRTKTLADLYRAIDKRRAVTITYTDDKGETTVRTIEAHDIRTTKNGRIEVRAMCRLRGEARRFFIDGISAYTVHRIGFVLELPAATTRASRAIVVHSERQLIARELGRDYLPKTPTRASTTLAA